MKKSRFYKDFAERQKPYKTLIVLTVLPKTVVKPMKNLKIMILMNFFFFFFSRPTSRAGAHIRNLLLGGLSKDLLIGRLKEGISYWEAPCAQAL